MDPIEIAVSVNAKQNSGMVGRAPGMRKCHACEDKLAKVKTVNERVNDVNRIVSVT